MIMAMATSAMLAITANAEGGDLASSKAVTGTKALLDDLSNVLLVVAPIAGTACVIYFAVRHGAADEMDQKKWKHCCCCRFHSSCCSGFGSHQGTRKLLPVRRGNMTTVYTSGFPP